MFMQVKIILYIALKDGIVEFRKKAKNKSYVSVTQLEN